MSLARLTFAQNPELCEKWSAVANSDYFGMVLMYARGALIELDLKEGELSGAKRFESILLELADKDPVSQVAPSSGLHHDLDVKPRSSKPTPEPKT